MTTAEEPNTQSQSGFPSLASLRRAHTALLRRQRSDSSSNVPNPAEIADFMRQARATGKNIAATESRDTAQGIIDYWYGILVLASRDFAATVGGLNLDEFDGAQAPADSDSEKETRARALATLADKVRAFDEKLPDADRPLLRRVLLRLFRLSESGSAVVRSQLLKSDEILSNPEADRLVREMLDKGLLRTESAGAEADGAYVLTDDGQLRDWPALRDLIVERRSLREMTSGWEKARRSSDALLERGPLLDLAADYVDLKQSERDFLSESRQASSRKGSDRKRNMLITIAILSLLALGLVWQTLKLSKQTRKLGEQNQKLEEQTIQLTNEKDAAVTARTQAEAARAAEKDAGVRYATQSQADAQKQQQLLQSQLDAANKAAAELKVIVETGRRAVENVDNLMAKLKPKLSETEQKSFTSTLNNLRSSLQLAVSSETTATELADTTGRAAVVAQDVVTGPQPRLVKVLEGHQKPITVVAFATDGRLATAGEDNLVRIWKSTGEKLTKDIQGSSRDGVKCLAFSPDGQLLAMGSNGSTVRLFDIKSEKSTAYEGHSDSITSVSFSSDASTILSSSGDRTVQIWDAHTLGPKKRFGPLGSIVTWAAFNPDATKVIASLDEPDKAAFLWTVGSDTKPIVLPMEAPVKRGAFNRAGTLIVTAGTGDKTAAIWNATTGARRSLLQGHSASVLQAVFDPSGKRVATASADMTVKLWNVDTGALIDTLVGHKGEVRHVAFSPTGKVLLSGSSDTTAKLWFEGEKEARHTLSGHTRRLTSIAFNHDGSQIATGSYDGTVRLWDVIEQSILPSPELTTGWSLYGWLDTSSDPPRLRSQSFGPREGNRNEIPQPGSVVTAEAIMNIRDVVNLRADGKYNQGKPIDLLRAGEAVQVLKVLSAKEAQPPVVWIQFKKWQATP